MRIVAAVLVLVTAPSPANATTYAIPDDYGIAALDLASGKVVWRTQAALRPPKLRVAGDLVVATEDRSLVRRGGKGKEVVFQATTGAIVKQRAKAGGVGELAEMPMSWAYKGRTVAHGESSTGGIFLEYDGVHGMTDLVWFDWDASQLFVMGRFVVFTIDMESGGEVFAWDLDANALAWDFRAYDHVKDLPERALARIAPDGDRVLVSTDERVFALEAATGKVLWRTDLPRQRIRMYDAPWTRFARVGDLLLLEVYEDLFALSAADGRLRWQFDGGLLGRPWPVVAGGRVYVPWRTGDVDVESTTLGGRGGFRPSAVVVRKDARGAWRLEVTTTRRAPAGTRRWSTLRRPPDAPGKPRVELTLSGGRGPTYDLSSVAGAEVWVEFKGIYDRATLTVDRKPVATIAIPRAL